MRDKHDLIASRCIDSTPIICTLDNPDQCLRLHRTEPHPTRDPDETPVSGLVEYFSIKLLTHEHRKHPSWVICLKPINSC